MTAESSSKPRRGVTVHSGDSGHGQHLMRGMTSGRVALLYPRPRCRSPRCQRPRRPPWDLATDDDGPDRRGVSHHLASMFRMARARALTTREDRELTG